MTQKDLLLADIGKQLDNLPAYGSLQVFVKTHVGGIGKVDMVRMSHTRYAEEKDPNVTLATDVYHLIKTMSDKRLTGSLGFSVTFKNGIAELMQVQDFKKI